MSVPNSPSPTRYSVRIPADVDREDTVLAHLTARQLLLLSVTGVVLYGLWTVSRPFVPVAVFLVVALPVAGAVAILALGQRDGVSLDRLLLAAIRQRTTPRHQVAAPEGIHPPPPWLARSATAPDGRSLTDTLAVPLQLPARDVTNTGVIDLGPDGLAAIGVCGTVNFALRTATEQEALVGAFGRYLHSLTAPVQILVRAERLDLSAQVAELRECAPALPHPSLEAAAREHADYLVTLADRVDLLRRQVLLVLREPLLSHPGVPAEGDSARPRALTARARRRHARRPSASDATWRAAEARLARRLTEAVELLGPIGITVTPLDAGQATAVLAAACNPDGLLRPSSALAGADEVITATAVPYEDREGREPP
ncbi:PrgI family protein [Streptomyces endophyticus]|uniref:PrgI family protein n=1 Tax=Streptomyces endophyticus TaxID=714166 RepID=A0ABU6F1Z1_9ACTN|nr:PrgI family protein [Streptomyces endophyticus]MEB8338021.1 PrgI family protein [Streptomyces endophyticus]